MGTFLKPEARKAVYDALRARYGGIGTMLAYNNHFELLIAVLLSAQTTDKQVNKVTPALFAAHPTPADIAKLTPEQVKEYIASIGFANTKAKNVVATSRILEAQYGGEVPEDMDALVALPGVGRKTASVVLSVGFGHPTIPVDTHVFRVSNRLGLADSDTVEATEQDLMKTMPPEIRADAHHWLIWHGREICKAPTPRCEQCFLTEQCFYFNHLGRWKKAKTVKKATPKKPTT